MSNFTKTFHCSSSGFDFGFGLDFFRRDPFSGRRDRFLFLLRLGRFIGIPHALVVVIIVYIIKIKRIISRSVPVTENMSMGTMTVKNKWRKYPSEAGSFGSN